MIYKLSNNSQNSGRHTRLSLHYKKKNLFRALQTDSKNCTCPAFTAIAFFLQ